MDKVRVSYDEMDSREYDSLEQAAKAVQSRIDQGVHAYHACFIDDDGNPICDGEGHEKRILIQYTATLTVKE